MKRHYRDIASSLLPRSKEKRNVDVAIREWLYSGSHKDRGKPDAICELCGHSGLRYQFEITNQFTRHFLWIGSECIHRFDIGVMDMHKPGERLSPLDAVKSIRKQKTHMYEESKYQSVFQALLDLMDAQQHAIEAGQPALSGHFDFGSFLTYYDRNRKFTPSQAAVLVWYFAEYGIDYNPVHFNIDLRGKYKEQLLQMPIWKVQKMKALLTSNQREMYHRETGQPL